MKDNVANLLATSSLSFFAHRTLLEFVEPGPQHLYSDSNNWFLQVHIGISMIRSQWIKLRAICKGYIPNLLANNPEINMRIMLLLFARAFPSIPSFRDNDIGHLRVGKYDSSVISPRPSKIRLPLPNYVAVLEHEPVPVVRVLSPLSCDVSRSV